MKPLTTRWILKAEEDFAAAQHLHRRRMKALPSIVCFHCQQCSEKYLKALLVDAEIAFPKTHDLLALVELLPLRAQFVKAFCDQLEVLNAYAVEFRYPDEAATTEEARIAFAFCSKLRAKIRAFWGLDEPPSAQMKLQIRERRARYRKQQRK